MKRQLGILQNVRIASPCNASWSTMQGDDHARFCEQCKLNVFNLSVLSEEAAEQLIIEKQGRLCVRYFQRADGTILTQDCPRGAARLRQQFRRFVLRGAAACLSLFAAIAALAAGPRGASQLSLRRLRPFTDVSVWAYRLEWRFRNWLSPPSPTLGTRMMGEMRLPVLPAVESLTGAQLAELDDVVHRNELLNPAYYARMDLHEKRQESLFEWSLLKESPRLINR